MSDNRPRAVDSKRKSDAALHIADFKIDDILSVPGDQLLAEVAADFGDPAFLAAQFDSIALPAVSHHDSSGVNRGRAVTPFAVQPAAPCMASVWVFPRPPPWSSSRAALAILAECLVVPLRRRTLLGAFATLLLVAALTSSIYPLLVNWSADLMSAVTQDDPLTQTPAPTSSRPLPTAPVGPADQSRVDAERAQALQALPAEWKPSRTVVDEREKAAGLVPDRELSRLPSAPVAPRASAPHLAAATPVNAPPPAVAKPRVTEGGGFFVQLSAPKGEAEALSTLRALKSKYAVLKGHEPVIRRKDEGELGVFYTVQVGPFESQDNADQLCKQLKTAGGICFVTRN